MKNHTNGEQYLSIAERALYISTEMNELFRLLIKLFENETERIKEMEQNRRAQIENDSVLF